MKKILPYLKKQRIRMIIGLTIKVIGTLMDLAIPYILTFIIDDVIPTIPENNYKPIILYGLLMIGCAIICFLLNVLANQSASYVAKCVTENLRNDLFMKVESLDSSQIDEITMPSLISRLSNDTYNVHQMVGMIQRLGVRAPILLIGGIIVTFTLDKVLTLVLLLTLPFIIFFTILISKLGIPLFKKVQESIDIMVKVIRENISGIRVIKALSKMDYEQKRFQKINKQVMDYELSSGYTMAFLNPLINIFLNIGLVMVVVVGAIRIKDGTTEVGKVIAFTTYFTIISNAMLSITRIFIILSRSIASLVRIEYVLDLPSKLKQEDKEEKHNDSLIEFDDVSFSYNKKEMNLEHISFQIKANETLGIIGSTGSGKTTIINLLMRFYDVDKGAIYIKGKNVKAYKKEDLIELFGTVFQNDTIFSNTIKENITFGRNIKENELNKAIKSSLSENIIYKNKEGLDTLLTPKGTNLSGGQKQRLFIARALANNPEILVLDDSSSALDYKTDSQLRNNIKENYKTTMIIIAQRISSIKDCNQIIVLDEGKIESIGAHNDLLLKSTIYQEIYRSQMGGGINE
ncbi:MAG: ABC transporter ATP-binding protein/permease [Acholeplasmataceae bacterium]|nr:ABC transporter ATP-binding protein/permease [Acholeplasmataceae bacterium]